MLCERASESTHRRHVVVRHGALVVFQHLASVDEGLHGAPCRVISACNLPGHSCMILVTPSTTPAKNAPSYPAGTLSLAQLRLSQHWDPTPDALHGFLPFTRNPPSRNAHADTGAKSCAHEPQGNHSLPTT